MTNDKHGVEIPSNDYVGRGFKKTNPNPDPHEDDTAWCRRCTGLGRISTAPVAHVCPECDGLGVTNGEQVVRKLPAEAAQIEGIIALLEVALQSAKELRGGMR